MRILVILALMGVTAVSAADDALDVEEAERLIVETLGAQALPPRADGWSYTVSGDDDEASMAVAMSRQGPLFRFVRGESGWRLAGMDLPEPPIETSPVADARATVLTIGPDDDVAGRIRAARLEGAKAVFVRFTGPLPAANAPAPAVPTDVPSTAVPARPAIPSAGPQPAQPPGDQAERVTREALERLAGALGRRQRSEGRFPAAHEGATIDEREKKGDFLYPFYLRRVPRVDGWETPIVYTAGRGGTRYELRSAGPDRKLGTGDDIVVVNGRFRAP